MTEMPIQTKDMTEIEKTQNSTKPSKNYGIELLRIISMLFIVVLHVIGQGGVAGASRHLSSQYMTSYTMLAFCYCAVNCYALISGYVGCKSKFRISRVVLLWLSVAAVNAAVWVSAYLYNKEMTAVMSFSSIFKPIIENQYWYFTSYIGLQILLPALNAAVNNIPKKQYTYMLLGMLVMFSVLPVYTNRDLFFTHSGYSMLWLAFMYIVGAYFRLHMRKIKIPLFKTLCFAVYAVSAAALALTKFCAERRLAENGSEYPYFADYYSYTSIFVVVCSIALFLLFVQINVKSRILVKIIGFFSKSTFGVYIIHTNIIVWVYVLGGRFAGWAQLSPFLLAVKVLAVSACIFIVCTAAEKLRELVFKILFIDKLVGLLDGKKSAGR